MRFLYYLILVPFSKLPSWILYRASDFLYLVIYRLGGYRKNVVRSNIRNSFPQLSLVEQVKIERKFYHHFFDLIMESIKAFTISKTELESRFAQRNAEIYDKYFANGQHVTMVGGHYGNWELFAVAVAMDIPHQPIALFTPLHNVFMNTKVTESRSKYGLWMKSYEQVKQIVQDTSQRPGVVIFGSDQCPNLKQQPFWMEFLNQETGVQFGAEKFARDNDTPVIYGIIHKIKRGHYEMEYKLVCEKPNELPLGEITKRHTQLLENDIKEEPGYWLWTHKRWKRSKEEFERVAEKRNS